MKILTTAIIGGMPTVYAFIRSSGVDRVVVVANLSAKPCRVTLDPGLVPGGADLFSGSVPPASAQSEIEAWGYRVYTR